MEEQTYWNPADEVGIEDVEKREAFIPSVLKKMSPKALRYLRNSFGYSAVLFLALSIFSVTSVRAFYEISTTLWYLSFIAWILVTLAVTFMQETGVVKAVAAAMSWKFRERASRHFVEILAEKYPMPFSRGHTRSLELVLQGKIHSSFAETNFLAGKFTYVTGGGKSRVTHVHSVALFELERETPVELLISPDDLGTDLLNMFTKTDVKLESTEFNRYFHISYNKKEANQRDVFSLLNPALMATLLDMRRDYGLLTILFKGRVMVVCASKPLVSHAFTNFFKDESIDARDIQSTASALLRLVELGNDASFNMD